MGLTSQRRAFLSEFTQSEVKPQPLVRTDEELILKRPWATYPFIKKQDFSVPIYNLQDGEYSGESVALDQEVFNVPLRRDLMNNAFLYHTFYGYKTTFTAKTKGTKAGSGKKPRPQKGGGIARQGNKRSPVNVKGAKAHGPKPKDYTININSKALLKAMKTTLTGLLFEKRIAVIQSEEMESGKTKYLAKLLKNFIYPHPRRLLFVVPIKGCVNFRRAAQNIKNIQVATAKDMTINQAIKAEAIIFTKGGLEEIEMLLATNHMELYRNRKIPRGKLPYDDRLCIDHRKSPDFFEKVQMEIEDFEFDPTAETEIYSKSLQGYLEKAEEYHKEVVEIEKSPEIMFVNRD